MKRTTGPNKHEGPDAAKPPAALEFAPLSASFEFQLPAQSDQDFLLGAAGSGAGLRKGDKFSNNATGPVLASPAACCSTDLLSLRNHNDLPRGASETG
mmetsp:Transcript_96656/g.211341  ORF Transcript_96656/g.211341 Transcript_96656/m.211341 type:complete len:98 (+) Transcript_96656:254-547(+)